MICLESSSKNKKALKNAFFLLYKAIQIHVFFQNNFMRKSWVTKNYLTEVPKYRFGLFT